MKRFRMGMEGEATGNEKWVIIEKVHNSLAGMIQVRGERLPGQIVVFSSLVKAKTKQIPLVCPRVSSSHQNSSVRLHLQLPVSHTTL